jgi:hypothetical protein
MMLAKGAGFGNRGGVWEVDFEEPVGLIKGDVWQAGRKRNGAVIP